MIETIERIHLIGIGGIGVSGVARALMALGYKVSGSDVRESQLTLGLREEGATVHIGHDAAHLAGAELVVYSTAIPDTNPELVAARAQNLPVAHRAQVLGEILARHELAIGVAGTHGKGTVSSAITWILEHSRRDPGFIIGGLLENLGMRNARLPDDLHLVVAEVDESDGSLKHVHPQIAVLNNLEADHLNYYRDLDHIKDTIVDAFNANERLRRVVLNADCMGAADIAERLNRPVTTFGREHDADIMATDVEVYGFGSRFTLTRNGEALGTIELELPGLYNLDNALAAATVGLLLDVPFDAIQGALKTFRGLENRFTVVDAGGRRIIKDYISHPTGIRRVLAAAKQMEGEITAVFKPYRFTMVNYHQDNYAEAFHDADHTVITELYTAGEVPIPGIDTAFLCEKIRSRGPTVAYVPDMDHIIPWLHDNVPVGGQVLFFGGDDLFRLADRYADELKARAAS